jgi:hypothetical protein
LIKKELRKKRNGVRGDAGYLMLDAGCWMLDAGFWILDSGCWILDWSI